MDFYLLHLAFDQERNLIFSLICHFETFKVLMGDSAYAILFMH